VQHAPLADQVEEAIANVQSILAASEPPKTDYFPALQQLQQIVEAANQELASSSPQAAPVMAAVTRIRDADLAEAADLAGEGDQARARSEFAQSQRTWTEVRGALREQLPSVVDRIDAAVARTERELAQEPAMQSEYAAALETLLQLVGEANAQLGN
jgi:ABC-type transporter Mla subunit MlaD